MPVLLRVRKLCSRVAATGRRLLRLLLIRYGQVSADTVGASMLRLTYTPDASLLLSTALPCISRQQVVIWLIEWSTIWASMRRSRASGSASPTFALPISESTAAACSLPLSAPVKQEVTRPVLHREKLDRRPSCRSRCCWRRHNGSGRV